jgi:acyl-coenzyme A thioesterase PaaI-like protein
MNIQTHKQIDQTLCGSPLTVRDGFSRVQLHTNKRMAADESGLVHGGFIFGVADYSAMIAVNHPNVVLGSADVRFLKPVKINEVVVAEAKLTSKEGKKYVVSVIVKQGDIDVFKGQFTCFVLDKHVLA